METGVFALWMLVGWCGTPPPRPWPFPNGPTPDPWIIKAVGVIGGLIGGLAYQTAFGIVVTDGYVAINTLATSLGAFIGARVLADAYNLFKGRQQG